jgi:hypothetical protein
MFPEHWERGKSGTGNVEHHFVKSWYEGVYLFRMLQSEVEHVPSVLGTMFPERCFGTRNVFQIIWDIITALWVQFILLLCFFW